MSGSLRRWARRFAAVGAATLLALCLVVANVARADDAPVAAVPPAAPAPPVPAAPASVGPASAGPASVGPATAPSAKEYARRRLALVYELNPKIRDRRVLQAIGKVPRHEFVPAELRERAYENTPLPIGEDQTISQPYVVALMTQLLELKSASKVLEIGTGSGYQAAVLAELSRHVYSIEIVKPLGERAAAVLGRLGYDRIHLRVGDGYLGWPEAAPFDRILVTCAPEDVPKPLQEQLAEGGRMVIPVGPDGNQELVVVVKEHGKLVRREVIPVRFVPMTGPGVEAAGEHPAKPISPPKDLN